MRNNVSAFNYFYVNVAHELVEMLPSPYNLFTPDSFLFQRFYGLKGVRENSFVLSPVSGKIVRDQLKSLKVNNSVG